jgi:hypothetical protein
MDARHATPQPATPRTTRPGRIAAAILTAVAAIGWTITPALAADPSAVSLAPSTAAPVEQIRNVDLSRDAAAVLQYRSYWCVPAAIQTMLNLLDGRTDLSYATQSRLYAEARRSNLYSYPTLGNDVRGWARVLTAHQPRGLGYADMSFKAQATAYAAIVDAMDRTKRPVGIVVDRGTHAWTVVGFRVRETSGVPGSRTILGFYVVGPLGSPKDPWPKRYYTVDQLSTRFTRYHEWQRAVIWEGRYVIVAPVIATGSVVVSR